MDKATVPSLGQQSIGAVERDTGLGKDTLRAWERRYGFPAPGRDANGERVYPVEQVAKLRMLKRLIDLGHRPGKIIRCGMAELQALAQAGLGRDAAQGASGEIPEPLLQLLELCRMHKADELRRALVQVMMRTGIQAFVLDVIAPLNRAVGEYWQLGKFEVYEEHLYTEVVQNVLRSGISTIPAMQPREQARPRILLTTFPQEQHALGLLMAEAIFTLEGARCVSLGVQTPIADIAQAAQDSDVVALSFSSTMNVNQALDGLSALGALLPPTMEIWAGGSSAALERCTLPNFHAVELTTVPQRMAAWRGRHAA